ncbi:MAG: type II toxin-antitoxin system HicB family antitoxin [archaeon]
MDYKIVFEKQDEGGYTVYVPLLPGCISQGKTKKAAIKNIKEAISLYLEEEEKLKIIRLKNAHVKAYA